MSRALARSTGLDVFKDPDGRRHVSREFPALITRFFFSLADYTYIFYTDMDFNLSKGPATAAVARADTNLANLDFVQALEEIARECDLGCANPKCSLNKLFSFIYSTLNAQLQRQTAVKVVELLLLLLY